MNEMKESEAPQNNKGVYNRLPIPFKYGTELCELFKPRELSLSELKRVQNRQFKTDNPIKWIAETCSLVMEEIGGVNPYRHFQDTKTFHPIILSLPLLNTTNIVAAGHIATLDSTIEDVPMPCPKCGKENQVKMDLLSLNVPRSEGMTYDDFLIQVSLDLGYPLTPKLAEQLGIDIKTTFTEFVFRLPTIGMVLPIEDDFGVGEGSEFNEKLMGRCIVSMHSKAGDELPNSTIVLHQDRIIKSLKVREIQTIIRAHNNSIPDLEIKGKDECTKCGSPIKYEVDNSFLFLMT